MLVAEQNLRDAELALSSARHDAYVTSAAVLQNIGWLELKNIVLIDHYYNPVEHLKRAEPKITVPWQSSLRQLDGNGHGPW